MVLKEELMKPTELPAAVRATDTRATLPIPAPPLETGAIVLRPEQVPQAQQALNISSPMPA